MWTTLSAGRLLDEVTLLSGMRLLEIGPGQAANLLFPASRIVGQHGRVIMADLRPQVVDVLEARRRQYLLHNVDILWGDAERSGGLPLPDGSVDRVVVVNRLWTLRFVPEFFKEISRVLAPQGEFMVVDWHGGSHHPLLPPRERLITPQVAGEALYRAGFVPRRFFRPSLAHWGLRCLKDV